MTESLSNWLKENRLSVSESKLNGSDIISVDSLGDMLYLHPFDGKVIDEDFGFILSDEEFDLIDEEKVKFILFEFGTKFYYSGIKRDRNRYNEIIFKPEFNDFKYIGRTTEPQVMEFSHLGVHSEYEMMNGSGACELWAKKAAFMGCKSLGICDKDTLAGTLPFQTACEKEGVKSIIGETVTVAINYSADKDVQETFEMKFFVLNYQGWKNLLQINKAINVDYDGFVPEEVMLKYGNGLACVIPKESQFNYIKKDRVACVKLISKYKKCFTDLYYQIDTVEYVSEQLFKRHLENIDAYLCHYRKLIKPILINDSYYLDREESALKGLLNKVTGKVSGESENQYFKSVEDTINAYSEWLDDVEPLSDVIIKGLENASALSDKVDFRISTGERKLPRFEVDDVEDLFFSELEKGFNEHFGKLSPKEQAVYKKQIETECAVIVPNGLCDYFMILWDIINWCHEHNIRTGPGRGSVCGSLIAYCLHITDVDPLKYGLMFERFLNETRVSGERAKSADSMPDIDVDFPTEFRDAVKAYIKERYGYAYTCSIGTYTRMKLKTCIKDFGKVKGLSFDYTNKLTKDIDDQVEYTWGDLIEYASKSKLLFKFVQENPELVHMSKYALLQPKAESVHPSAVVIVPKNAVDDGREIDLWEWMPIKKIDGLLVSEWEGKYIDKSGFLKEDILGLNQLDKFSNILALIEKNCHKKIDLNKIPLDDDEVFRYFKRGWNEDVFQFGTTGLMNYCRQVKPSSMADLIAMTALFRPGPMDINAHQDFADIKSGKKKTSYDFGMESITKETYGLYVYQEQIMKAAVVGGLSPIESDVMRTAIKKKKLDVLNSFGDKFKQGYAKLLEKNGIDEPKDYAEKVWEKLLAFSGYGFNKSHAAAYTIMSYWSQWFKVNYPLEFWTTALQFSKESEVPYRLAELKKTGVEVEIRPPDVNFSEGNFTCDSKEQRIFFSLTKIKGVGETAVKNIVETRAAGGQFFNLEEFLSRVPSKVNKTVVKCLIIAGAFDLIENIKNPRDRRNLLKHYLVDIKGESLPDEYNTDDAKTNAFWIIEQKRLTGFGEVDYESMIRDSIPNKRVAKMYVNDTEFLDSKQDTEVTVAGKLIYYQEKEIKNGTMCTLQIDCNNTIIPILLWPDAYEKIPEPIDEIKGMTIAICGQVKKDKFKNEKKLYSNSGTKLYVLSNHKVASTKFEEHFNKKL